MNNSILVPSIGVFALLALVACGEQQTINPSTGEPEVLKLPTNPSPKQAKTIYDEMEARLGPSEERLAEARARNNAKAIKKWLNVVKQINRGKDYYDDFLEETNRSDSRRQQV